MLVSIDLDKNICLMRNYSSFDISLFCNALKFSQFICITTDDRKMSIFGINSKTSEYFSTEVYSDG